MLTHKSPCATKIIIAANIYLYLEKSFKARIIAPLDNILSATPFILYDIVMHLVY